MLSPLIFCGCWLETERVGSAAARAAEVAETTKFLREIPLILSILSSVNGNSAGIEKALLALRPARGVSIAIEFFILSRGLDWIAAGRVQGFDSIAYSPPSIKLPNRSIRRSHSDRCSRTHRSSVSNPSEAIRHVRTRPIFSVVTSPHFSSISRCCPTAVSVISSGRPIATPIPVPGINRSIIARRVSVSERMKHPIDIHPTLCHAPAFIGQSRSQSHLAKRHFCHGSGNRPSAPAHRRLSHSSLTIEPSLSISLFPPFFSHLRPIRPFKEGSLMGEDQIRSLVRGHQFNVTCDAEKIPVLLFIVEAVTMRSPGTIC